VAASASGEPEPQVKTVTHVSVQEIPTFLESCSDYTRLADKAACRNWRVKSALAATTTTAPEPTTTATPKPTQPPPATIEQGTWAVPDEVKPGTYVSDGGEGCYWARLRDLTGGINSIIANGGNVGRQRVTILRSDKGFETNECGVWRKVG
jgi:hypothetical protein